jgi:histidinol dehydrogenase
VLAQNENGEDAASILVTVTAPPSPAGKPVVIDITGTTCTLRQAEFIEYIQSNLICTLRQTCAEALQYMNTYIPVCECVYRT